MAEKTPPPSLEDFDRRLKDARTASKPAKDDDSPQSGIGIGMRLSMELVIGGVFGGVVGWFIDGWAGTAPLFLLVLGLLGVAAGVRNAFLFAERMSKADAERLKAREQEAERDQGSKG